MTLQEFIKRHGSMEKAAKQLGVTSREIYRWIHGINKPRGLYAKLLKDHNIKIKERENV